MKDYVITTLETSKVTAYKKFKNNSELMKVLDSRYPHISDFVLRIKLFINDLDDVPQCKYPLCSNKVLPICKKGKFNEYCSKKCSSNHFVQNGRMNSILEKMKKTNLERYGTVAPLQSDKIKKKVKKTNLERYGVENALQSDKIKEKIKKTNLEKYGVESPMQSDKIKEKTKQTNLEKYGVENPSSLEEVRNKVKQTNLEKYGVEYFSQSEEYNNKVKQTNLERYGVDYYSQTDESKERIKQTSLEKYGVENYSQTNDFKKKSKESNIKKYGVEHHMFRDESKERIKQTSLEKYGVEHHRKKHYNSEYINAFDNIDQFKKLLYEHGTYKLAELVGCCVSTIYYISKQYTISLPPRSNSYQEEIIHDFLNHHNINYIMNSRKILPSGLELDFYFPEYNLAIEMNGLYWHSEISGGKDRNYHYNKWKECNDLGITLLSINEDEFSDRQQFWFNKILYMVGNSNLKKIHARKCKVVELDNVSGFLNEHHLQGSNSSKYKFGLTYEDQLVAVMTFSNPRGNKFGTIDLSRFCNHSGYLISGSASKLLSYFIKTHGHLYKEIISFSDNNYSNGKVYKSLGFSLDKNLAPDYKYIIKGKTCHKAGYRKSSIFSKFIIPSDMKDFPEWELMKYLGYDRIWDTGKKKWTKCL